MMYLIAYSILINRIHLVRPSLLSHRTGKKGRNRNRIRIKSFQLLFLVAQLISQMIFFLRIFKNLMWIQMHFSKNAAVFDNLDHLGFEICLQFAFSLWNKYSKSPKYALFGGFSSNYSFGCLLQMAKRS